MRRTWNRLERKLLLRLRIHAKPTGLAAGGNINPFSLEYLYLVQQAKRLSLSATLGRIRPSSLLMWPVVLPVAVVKTFDLWMTTLLIRSMLNEHDLMARIIDHAPPEG
jgi:hypothetical protein